MASERSRPRRFSLEITFRDQRLPSTSERELISLLLFDCGATAVSEPGTGQLVAGFDTLEAATTARDSVRDRHVGIADVVVSEETDDEWVKAQREGIHATRIAGFVIRPPWEAAPSGIVAHRDVVIDPGAAFGHGGHPTTRLAIEMLVRHAGPRTRVLDIGTGTGVLGIVAARLGSAVTAIDNDPAAVEMARANVERNDVSSIQVRLGDVSDPFDISEFDVAEFDIVVANLTLGIQAKVAPALQNAPLVLLTGLLSRQIEEVRSLYPDHNPVSLSNASEWAGVELVARQPLG